MKASQRKQNKQFLKHQRKQSELVFLETISIPLCELRFQYIGTTYNAEVFPGKDPMRVSNTPHVRLLEKYLSVGKDWDELWDSDYVRMLQYWESIGYTGSSKNRDKKFIMQRIKKLITLYESIKKIGIESPIEVLEESFWKTRYNAKEPFLDKYEIWHGHHRSACAFLLGMDNVICRLLRDKNPGTGKSKLDRRLRACT